MERPPRALRSLADLLRSVRKGRRDGTFASYRADLSESDLSAAQVSEGQLATCKSIEGDTIPDGPKYEDWLKSKGRGRMGENSSP